MYNEQLTENYFNFLFSYEDMENLRTYFSNIKFLRNEYNTNILKKKMVIENYSENIDNDTLINLISVNKRKISESLESFNKRERMNILSKIKKEIHEENL